MSKNPENSKKTFTKGQKSYIMTLRIVIEQNRYKKEGGLYMKKQLNKIVMIVLLAFSLVAISQMAVHAQEKTKVNLLKTSEESYIIYVEDTINTEFLFCFSENLQGIEQLTFSASGLDSNELNVAYMDKSLAQSLENGKTHMWVKVEEELTNYEIDLTQAVTAEEILFVNSTTKRIDVNTEGAEKTNQEVDGVKISHSQGKITVTENGQNFSYYIEKVENQETINFVKLANRIIDSSELSNYERVKIVREFNDTYTERFAKIENWETLAENKEILQPQESKKDEIYLVWLKNNETAENDVQILVCDDHQDIEVEEEKKVIVYETTKLPVTYDSVITLIIILVIVLVAIIALVIAKKKLNKKEN